MLIKYQVTKEDIDNARHSTTWCPIARCLQRSGHPDAAVGIHNGHYVARCALQPVHWVYLPSIAENLALAFDSREPIEPIEFEFDCDGPNALETYAS